MDWKDEPSERLFRWVEGRHCAGQASAFPHLSLLISGWGLWLVFFGFFVFSLGNLVWLFPLCFVCTVWGCNKILVFKIQEEHSIPLIVLICFPSLVRALCSGVQIPKCKGVSEPFQAKLKAKPFRLVTPSLVYLPVMICRWITMEGWTSDGVSLVSESLLSKQQRNILFPFGCDISESRQWSEVDTQDSGQLIKLFLLKGVTGKKGLSFVGFGLLLGFFLLLKIRGGIFLQHHCSCLTLQLPLMSPQGRVLIDSHGMIKLSQGAAPCPRAPCWRFCPFSPHHCEHHSSRAERERDTQEALGVLFPRGSNKEDAARSPPSLSSCLLIRVQRSQWNRSREGWMYPFALVWQNKINWIQGT